MHHLEIMTIARMRGILLRVLLSCRPESATRTRPLTLTSNVRPRTLINTSSLTHLRLCRITQFLTRMSTSMVIVISLSRRTGSLAVLTLNVGRVFLFYCLAGFVLSIVASERGHFSWLPAFCLDRGVDLILCKIEAHGRPFVTIFVHFNLHVVAYNSRIMIITRLLVGNAGLSRPITRRVEIQNRSDLRLVRNMTDRLIPMFLVTIGCLRLTTVLTYRNDDRLRIFL